MQKYTAIWDFPFGSWKGTCLFFPRAEQALKNNNNNKNPWESCFKGICLPIHILLNKMARVNPKNILMDSNFLSSISWQFPGIYSLSPAFSVSLGGGERRIMDLKKPSLSFSLFLSTEGVPLVVKAKASLAFHLILCYFTHTQRPLVFCLSSFNSSCF